MLHTIWFVLVGFVGVQGWAPILPPSSRPPRAQAASRQLGPLHATAQMEPGDAVSTPSSSSRRGFFERALSLVAAATGPTAVSFTPLVVNSSPAHAAATSTTDAVVTDKIYLTVKGLPKSDDADAPPTRRIVIGLFGQDAPLTTQQVKQLVSFQGLPAPCRPKAERTLQKEQLEANKVYNGCKEAESDGVTLRYSTIWRVVPNQRIDVGAVTGKFVAREYPTFEEKDESLSSLRHDAPGVVSVRRGNEGGFGLTIYPGGGSTGELDQDHIVVGRVLEGMDVVAALNAVPVISSAKGANYMSLTGTTTKNAPTRSCQYGGNMYCNENKPLVKLTLTETGIL